MKHLFLLLSLPLLLLSCNKEKFDPDRNPDLIGTWKVTEQYADPGDGSGDFADVDYDHTYTFLADGTITSDRDMCALFNGTDEEVDSRGTYDPVAGTIDPDDCDFNPYFGFELDGNILTIQYLCFEGCAVRLRKLR